MVGCFERGSIGTKATPVSTRNKFRYFPRSRQALRRPFDSIASCGVRPTRFLSQAKCPSPKTQTRRPMVRKGRTKQSVAGERYDSNAVPVVQPTPTRTRRQPGGFNPADLMGMLGAGGGGMPDMSQMMDMMRGMPPMMGGMPGMPGMMPPMEPISPPVIYVYGLAEGSPISTFFTFYPTYLDSNKTVQQGRRISKLRACASPMATEMSEVCTYLKLPHVLEPSKKYPRDWRVSGRVRVRLVRDDGAVENPEIPNRKTLMLKMAELIPKLQSRKVRLEKEAEARKNKAATPGAVPVSASGGKKKGKKKGRK